MEPLAPGTEDEPICNKEFKASNKGTAEEQALSRKAFLPDGSYGNVFLLEYVQGLKHWFCKVCNRPVFGQVFNHEIGKRHLSRLKFCKNEVPGGIDGNDNDDEEEDMAVVVAPGEPLPPGFEGEMEVKAYIQDRLDKFSAGPLVGVEYLLEIMDYDPSKEPKYLCVLCQKKGDPRTILTHLASYNHQIKYIQKHFPSAHRHIAPYMGKEYRRNWQYGLHKILDAIETTFGRLKPTQVEGSKFNENNAYYCSIVEKGKHFSELSGQTFENVVTKEELSKIEEDEEEMEKATAAKRKSPSPPVVAKPVIKSKPAETVQTQPRKRSLSPISDVSSSDLEDYDPKSPKKFANDRKGKSAFSRNNVPMRKEGHLPWQKSNYRRDRPVLKEDRNKDEKAEKLEEFKRLAKAIDNQMEQVLKKNRENPEKHPKYNDEWKQFWNTRYKELQSQGKNAASHDFKPEWIEYWNKRMLELHEEEARISKMALKKRLGIEDPPPISFKIGDRKKPLEKSKGPVPTAAQPDDDPEVIIIDDKKDTVTHNRRSPARKRNLSPHSRHRNSSPPSSRRRKSPSPSRREFRNREYSPSRRREPTYPHRDSSSRIKESPKRQLSPLSRRKSSPSAHRAPSPPVRGMKIDKMSPISSDSDRSPRCDKFERLEKRSIERSSSRGKSREMSWERERERRRDYDEIHRESRGYRVREVPWELDYYPKDPYAPPKIQRDVTRQPVGLANEPEEDGDVNIVAVLRLLTALEEKLGSLGPKVIDLLAQALAMEKKEANSSEQLLDNEINCVLFETVKEKLKGQLQAGLVDWIQEKAFKTAIKKTATLIHMAGQRKKQKEEELPKKPVVVPGIGKVDKGKIARQIASALVAQGKTDVTQSELEQLINAVVGIAEAQKNSSETLTTASFLEKLSNSQTSQNPEKPKQEPEQEKKKVDEIIHLKVEEQEASSSAQEKSTLNMEALSDSDLETLLQNFKHLSNDEQLGLINYLKKLEAKDPERVEKLRKFVKLPENHDTKTDSNKYSPFSPNNETSKKDDIDKKGNETKEDNSEFINIDSEDEYSFEDVVKSVSQKVIEKEKEQKKLTDTKLDDTKSFITSLVTSLNKNTTSSSPTSNVASIDASTKKTEKINVISDISVNPVSSADIVKSLSGVTMSVSSLGNILGSIQNLTNNSEIRDPKVHNQNPTSNSNICPVAPPSATLSSNNEFNISNNQSVRSNTGFVCQEKSMVPPNKPYDEFRHTRTQVPLNSQGSSNLPPSHQGISQPNRYAPFPNTQRPPLRVNTVQDRPSPPFPSQYPPSGGSLPNNRRPDANNFGPRGAQGNFGPRDGDFRYGMSDQREGMYDQRGEFSDERSGNSNFRGPITDYRRGTNDFRDGSTNFANDSRADMRGPPGNFQDVHEDMRYNQGELRSDYRHPRGGGQPRRGGNFNKSNRPNNYGQPPKFSGGNNFNRYNNW